MAACIAKRSWVFVLSFATLATACSRAEKRAERNGDPAGGIGRMVPAPPSTASNPYEEHFGNSPPPQGPLPYDERLAAGDYVLAHTCVTCHQPSGRGMPNAFPPLAGSDFLLADKGRSIGIVLGGLTGPIVVNGQPYSASMPSHGFLTDDDIANVLTFVR